MAPVERDILVFSLKGKDKVFSICTSLKYFWNKAPLEWITTVLIRRREFIPVVKRQIQDFVVTFFFLVDLVNCIKWRINTQKHICLTRLLGISECKIQNVLKQTLITRHMTLTSSPCQCGSFTSSGLLGGSSFSITSTRTFALKERNFRKTRHPDRMFLQPLLGTFYV